ncbi:alpha/beta hydrolase [Timonella senegalensis]|uniref:alpha/beta hydrolase n=1 Tax=Timonella senegalensis TaxID=1465825 RepID=UPI0028A685A4|nr:alpha/beta hydrolase [Timonella senegalensis]
MPQPHTPHNTEPSWFSLIGGDAPSPQPPHALDHAWRPDELGPTYFQSTLDLGEDDEGKVYATVVKYEPAGFVRAARAVLYVHGWSDYFFQTETSEFWHAQGSAFYALDLRKYGRSLRDWQTPGYVDDLATYAFDISAALTLIRAELGAHTSIMLIGHSTGGLVCSLWAHYNPGEVSGLVLNSPWLELQGSSIVRTMSQPALAQLARINPKAPLPSIDAGFYAKTINAKFGGEWEYNESWRPNPSFPVRPGWLSAITTGHARVARGLHITAPILVLASTKTTILARWSDEMLRSDSVLEVDQIARRAVQLGENVTVRRIPEGVHDLALSPKPVRDVYYESIRQWSTAYGWSSTVN